MARSVMEIRVAVPGAATVGEGPAWSPAASRLVWVDIPAGRVHTSDVTTGATETVTVPASVGSVGAAVPTVDGELVLATEAGFGVLRDGEVTMHVERRVVGERMNDAKCDAAGRLWAGSTAIDFTPGRGALHVVGAGWQHRVVADGFTLPNGLGWSPDSTAFYLVDTMQCVLYRYGFDLASARLGERDVLFEWTADGVPDGLTVDADGGLWLAIWDAGRVVHLDPSGTVLGEIALPARRTSSCTFGGPRWDRLYVTSAREGLDLADGAVDGSVFEVTGLGVVGQPTALFGTAKGVDG